MDILLVFSIPGSELKKIFTKKGKREVGGEDGEKLWNNKTEWYIGCLDHLGGYYTDSFSPSSFDHNGAILVVSPVSKWRKT